MVLDCLLAIIAARGALGAAEALVVISSTTLIGDYFHGRAREKWLVNQTAVASISSVFLALLGGALGNFGGRRGPFAAYGVSILFAISLIKWTWAPSKSEQPKDHLAGAEARFPWATIMPITLLAMSGGTMFFTIQVQVSAVLNDYYNIRSASQQALYSSLAGGRGRYADLSAVHCPTGRQPPAADRARFAGRRIHHDEPFSDFECLHRLAGRQPNR